VWQRQLGVPQRVVRVTRLPGRQMPILAISARRGRQLTVTAPPGRTAALAAARADDSRHKRQRALDALAQLEAAGETVKFPAVAKAAGVSTWLVYAPGVREHVEATRRRQTERSATPKTNATPASLHVDLALAREEIKRLRTEHHKLQQRLRLQLGAEIDGPPRAELIARVADLEAVNRRLVAERDARSSQNRAAQRRLRELEDELAAAREGLRRMIRSENSGTLNRPGRNP
jgi:Family of unknown function (DUF6262)